RNGEPPSLGRPAPSAQAGFAFDPDGQTSRLVVCFDEGRPVRRREIYPPYQTGREGNSSFTENEPFVLRGIEQFIEAARALPIEVVRGTNTEADDLIAAVVAQATESKVRIASTDRDFLQLVDMRVSVFSPVKRIVINDSNFSEVTSPRSSDDVPITFPRERYLDYRAASGDASDDLPGIPGVGALTAARLLAHAELDEYFKSPALAGEALGRRNARLEAALGGGDAQDAVTRNRALMDLRLAANRYPNLSSYTRHGAWDETAFRSWVVNQRIAALDLESACVTMRRLS
ncbi:MAG: hypothetical protein ABI782_07550, partial [Anaerolineaceae bacterium]